MCVCVCMCVCVWLNVSCAWSRSNRLIKEEDFMVPTGQNYNINGFTSDDRKSLC